MLLTYQQLLMLLKNPQFLMYLMFLKSETLLKLLLLLPLLKNPQFLMYLMYHKSLILQK
jgi:hypothetical protein